MNRVRFLTKTENQTEVQMSCAGDVEFFVKTGSEVKQGDKLFKINRRELLESHYLPKLLGVKPNKCLDYIGRVPGEFVSEGELIAEKLTSAGMVTKKITAGVDGIISIDRISKGYLDILGEYENIIIKSPFVGRVKEIVINEFLVFETSAAVCEYLIDKNLDNSAKLSDEITGRIELLNEGENMYKLNTLKDSYNGSIVFTGRHLYPNLARQLYQKGAICIVTYSMDYIDFQELDVPVIVMAGFGQLRVNRAIMDFLKDSSGLVAKIDPLKNQVQIVGKEGTDLKTFKGNKYFAPVLSEGMNVRVNQGDRFGTMAEISPSVDEGMRDEGYQSVKTDDGTGMIIDSTALEVLVL